MNEQPPDTREAESDTRQAAPDIETLVDEELAAGQQVQLPAMTIPLAGCGFRVGQMPDGTRVIEVGPLVVSFHIPLTPEAARNMGTQLNGGIEIADAGRIQRLPERPAR